MDSLAPIGSIRVRISSDRVQRAYFSNDDEVFMIDSSTEESGIEAEKIRSELHSKLRRTATLKKKKRRVQMDATVTGRRRVGRRRMQRFKNDNFTDIEMDEDELEAKRALWEIEYRSAFKEISESLEKKKKWEPFVSVTMEEEERMLRELGILPSEPKKNKASTTRSSHAADADAPARRFGRIDKKIRVQLRRQRGSPFLKEVEQELVKFIQSNEKGSLVLTFKEGFHRMMVHGLCQYLGLPSHSIDVPETHERATVINYPKSVELVVPTMLLSDYIDHMHKQLEQTARAKFQNIVDIKMIHENKDKKGSNNKKKRSESARKKAWRGRRTSAKNRRMAYQ